jgi:hypothetical protein
MRCGKGRDSIALSSDSGRRGGVGGRRRKCHGAKIRPVIRRGDGKLMPLFFYPPLTEFFDPCFDRRTIVQLTGEFVDGQTIGQLTGEFVGGQTIGQLWRVRRRTETSGELTGEFDDGQTIGQLTGEFVDGQTIGQLTG